MKPSEVLSRAQDMISSPNHWGQGFFNRRTEEGDLAYCAIGAIRRAAVHIGDEYDLYQAEGLFRRANDIVNIINWNDDSKRKHSEVIAAFTKAVALAQVQEEATEPAPVCLLLKVAKV